MVFDPGIECLTGDGEYHTCFCFCVSFIEIRYGSCSQVITVASHSMRGIAQLTTLCLGIV
jgi:hypothetical protein